MKEENEFELKEETKSITSRKRFWDGRKVCLKNENFMITMLHFVASFCCFFVVYEVVGRENGVFENSFFKDKTISDDMFFVVVIINLV